MSTRAGRWRALADDAAGFTAFARSRSRSLLRTAYALTGDTQLAQDVVQEALIRLYTVWDTTRFDNPDAYANTVLVRSYFSMRRRRSFFERPSDQLADSAAPERDASLRLTLFAALDKLSRTDRTVVVLRYFCDLSVDDVARYLDRSPAAVRTASKRALERLRALIGPQLFSELAVGP